MRRISVGRSTTISFVMTLLLVVVPDCISGERQLRRSNHMYCEFSGNIGGCPNCTNNFYNCFVTMTSGFTYGTCKPETNASCTTGTLSCATTSALDCLVPPNVVNPLTCGALDEKHLSLIRRRITPY